MLVMTLSLSLSLQHLIERSWFAILDTFILLAAFHQDLSPLFVAKVTLLFVMKSFHWLAGDRVEHVSSFSFSYLNCMCCTCEVGEV